MFADAIEILTSTKNLGRQTKHVLVHCLIELTFVKYSQQASFWKEYNAIARHPLILLFAALS